MRPAGRLFANCPTRRGAGQFADLSGHLDAGRSGAHDTTKVSRRARSGGFGSTSAISNAQKMRARSSGASSMVFMPGANVSGSSCQGKNCPAPNSHDQPVVGSLLLLVVEALREDPVRGVDARHQARLDAGVGLPLEMSRVAGAMEPLDKMR